MKFGTWLAIYFIVWWVMLFAALPFAVRRDAEPDEVVAGSDPGAPARPNLKRALLITTSLAAIITAAFWWLINNYWV
ncbi:MAG TPA: DUF1467 family protein [Beijerinckiaceae bacterium]|nr:DUF1467 family protein [Beijerinckiaceae bacterium]